MQTYKEYQSLLLKRRSQSSQLRVQRALIFINKTIEELNYLDLPLELDFTHDPTMINEFSELDLPLFSKELSDKKWVIKEIKFGRFRKTGYRLANHRQIILDSTDT